MNALKILVEHTGRPIEETEDVKEIRDAMIGYAEYYAEKCLEIADNHLKNEDKGFRRVWPLMIKLPEHD